MNKEFIAREIAIYSALASLMQEFGTDYKTFTFEEVCVLGRTIELMEKHEEALSALIDQSPEEFTKEIFIVQANRVKSLLENMEQEGDL